MSDTQSRTSAFFDLTADDVNMVKMSRTGIDRTIGGVDDHAIGIDLVSCAGAWDIKIKVGTTVLPTSLGECTAPVDFVFPGGPHSSAQDYKILGPTTLVLRNTVAWELGIPVFWNGFESGTTNHWSSVTP